MTIAMKNPAAAGALVQASASGKTYTADANGFVNADPNDIDGLLRAGFSMVGDSQIGGAQALANNALTTAGAGTLTAAMIAAGLITRTGPTAVYTDTTDTAVAIIAAQPSASLNDSWLVLHKNTVAFPATIAGGAGVTVTGNAVVPPLHMGWFLATITGAATVSLRGLGAIPLVAQPPAVYSTAALQSTVIPAANLTGAGSVALENTGTTPANLQLDTAANIIAAIPNALAGYGWDVAVRNSSSGANTATLTTNTGLTLHGTMTIAQNVTRYFKFVINAAGTGIDVWSMGISAAAV